jgi:hypothetical protein
VIFSHAGDAIRLGALDFDQLIDQQESGFRQRLNEFRKDLRRLNQEINGFEDQLQPEVRRALLELQAQKNRQIEEHVKIKPEPMAKPAAELSPEQKNIAVSLDDISTKLKALEDGANANAVSDSVLAGKLKAIQNVRERLRLLDRSHKQFLDDTAKDLVTLSLKASDLATLTIHHQPLDRLVTSIPEEQAKLKVAAEGAAEERAKLLASQAILNTKLNEPQLLYQKNQKAIESWEAKLTELQGAADAPETLKGLQERIAQLDNLPLQLASHQEQRIKLSCEIFDILNAQRKAREELFKPVQDLIQNNRLIRDEYKLQFQATLGGSADLVAESLFSLMKQNSGEFRGEDESYGAVRKLAEKYDFNKRDDVLNFVTQLNRKIAVAAGNGSRSSIGISHFAKR